MFDIDNEIDDESYICQFTQTRDHLDELNDDDEDNEVRPNINKRKKKNNNKTVQSPPVEFMPFQHSFQLHNSSINLPNSLQFENATPYFIFSQFFFLNKLKLLYKIQTFMHIIILQKNLKKIIIGVN